MKKYRTFDMELYFAEPGTEGTKILKYLNSRCFCLLYMYLGPWKSPVIETFIIAILHSSKNVRH